MFAFSVLVVGGTDVPKATKKMRRIRFGIAFRISSRLLVSRLLSTIVFSSRVSRLKLTGHSCSSAMTTTKSNLTVGLVGKMTTFELRQEVEKRGLLSELQSINHDTLLRRLVQVNGNTKYWSLQKIQRLSCPTVQLLGTEHRALWHCGSSEYACIASWQISMP